MFHRLKDSLRRRWFAARCAGILDTPPATFNPASGVMIFTQLQHKDVLLFVLAAKSFIRQVGISGVAILNDGSLSDEDIVILRHHFPGLGVYGRDQFSSGQCPRGGCWERLLAIAELSRSRYVIQLDSDTLTLTDLPEVLSCVQSGTGFTIGTWDGQEFESMAYRAKRAQSFHPARESHIQLYAEAHFDRLQDHERLRYVRGCAGFAGFPKRSVSKEFIENISNQMTSIIGDKWQEWGSEQVMSNIVVANMQDSIVLPHPRYSDCQKMRPPDTVFVHFIGSCRFNRGIYARLGKDLVQELLGQS
jgi:hypothetical protein